MTTNFVCSNEIDNNIKTLVNINELQDDYQPIISEIKRSQSIPKVHINQSKIANDIIRKKWYNNYTVPETYVDINAIESENTTESADFLATSMESKSVKPGESISAIEAINGQFPNVDIRPKVFDNITKSWVLLDSGSCVSCYPAAPTDVINPNFKLRSVNGGQIDTYGHKRMSLRLGRKEYHINAVIAAVPSPIFGWDIFNKYKLSLNWNENDELEVIDKKANVKSKLKYEVMEANFSPRIQEISQVESETAYFELKCMQKLDQFVSAIDFGNNEDTFIEANLPLSAEADPDFDKDEKTNLEALKKLDKAYVDLIQKYPNILKNTFKKDPKHKIFHSIETTDDIPVTSKVRPLLATSEKSQQGKLVWEEMEKMGVIERVDPSQLHEYSSSLHLVKKPSGKGWRPTVDFRPLNLKTKSECYPLPKLKSFASKLKGSKVFSKIDLRSAFWNLAIHPNSIKKTCTLSPWGGAFVFKRLPFGLKNGPGTWMKFLHHVLRGVDNVFCYLDDLLVYNDSEEAHQKTLDEIFNRLEENGLTLALDKCQFSQESVEYLGFQVTTTGLVPLPKKVDAVYNIPPPTTQKELLAFLGALNYFRPNLSGLNKAGKYHNTASLLQPLYSAATTNIPSKKHFQQIWDNSPILKESFLDAKKLLINATKLGYQDPNLPLELYCDASEHSIGSVLMQVQGNKRVPLGYFSKHLPLEKTHWAVYRKELEAAKQGLRYFIEEIYGRHLVIYSDHMPLVKAWEGQGFQPHDPVAQRALLEISQFTKDIRHISGDNNCGSDYLSRIPPPEKRGTVYLDAAAMEGHSLEAVSPAVIFEEQQSCEEIKEIKNGNHPPSTTFQEVKFGDHMLFCEVSGAQPRPCLPRPLRFFVQKQLHFDHKGQKEAVRRLSSNYYWKTIRNDTINFIKTCHGCQSTTSSKTKAPHIGSFDEPDQRFSHCHLDIVGPLPPSKGYKYILTIKDRFTRFLQAIPLVNPTSEAIAEAFMLHWTALFGLPSICTSDHGPNLTSNLFKSLQEMLGIKVEYSPIYYPQANGMVERSHQTLKNSIKASLIEMGDKYQQNWIYYLPWALLGLRTAYNNDLGTSSMEMTIGKHGQLPGTILADAKDIMTLKDIDVDSILRKLQLKNNRVAVPPSLNRPNPETKPLPDSVTHVYARQHNTKGLTPRYMGPFPVTSRPSRSTIEIKVGLNKDGSERKEIRHISDIKVAYLREDAEIATRPKRGRPPKPRPQPDVNPDPPSTLLNVNKPENSRNEPSFQSPNLDDDPPFHGFGAAAIDLSFPHKAPNSNAWSASKEELRKLNKSINRSL